MNKTDEANTTNAAMAHAGINATERLGNVGRRNKNVRRRRTTTTIGMQEDGMGSLFDGMMIGNDDERATVVRCQGV